MKFEELRLNNLIHIKKSGKIQEDIYQVKSINKHIITFAAIDASRIYDSRLLNAIGIPLSEELLAHTNLRREDDVYYVTECLCIKQIEDNYVLSSNNYKLLDVRSLHQLQNIHYDFTGSELKVSLREIAWKYF